MSATYASLPVLQELRSRRRQGTLLAMALLSMSALFLSISMGAIDLPLWQLITGQSTDLERTIFADIRSPRVLLAAAVGAVLGVSGGALQGLFRNPLADPSLIGVSSGAALGAVTAIFFAAVAPPWLAPYLVPIAAISGAMLVTLFLYGFSQRYGQFSIVTILLVGIAVNALAMVGVSGFEYLSDDTQLRALVFWMMGSFGRATWITVLPGLCLMAVATMVLWRQARRLDLLQLGEADAMHLGVNVGRLKVVCVLSVASGVGAAVSLSGMIGFVGLVVPHLSRLLLGAGHKYVLPGSVLLGSGLMVFADLIARSVIVPAEIPVSLVTSAIGAPFFLWLIARVRPR